MHCLQMYKSSIFGQLLWMDIFLSIKVCLSVSLKLIWSLISYACLWHSCCSKVEEKRRQGKEGISLLLAISGSRFFFFFCCIVSYQEQLQRENYSVTFTAFPSAVINQIWQELYRIYQCGS